MKMMRDIRFKSRKSQSRKLAFLFFLIVIGMILLWVTTAEAQIKEKVRAELEKTDVVIQRAKEAVFESRNIKAEELLKMAIALQGKARDAFFMIKYKMAVELTLMARKKAYEAIGFTKRDEENENLVLKAIERTDQIITKAKESIVGLEHKRASSLLEAAINNQQKAKEFFKEHKLKVALKLTLKAREMAKKVLDLTTKGRRLNRLAQKELKITDRMIQKASLILQESESKGPDRLLEKAKSLQEKAREMFRQKKFTRATRSSRKARELVEKALRLVEEEVTPRMVENAIQQNERLISQVEEGIKGGTNPEAASTLEKGLAHQRKAKKYYQEGKFKPALAEAKVAKRLISKAREMSQKGKL